MNRLDRISAILIQLQSKRVVKAQDIAERFGISLRTVYRDIRTLELAGIPLIGESGVGYSIMDGYRLPPVMFTREEASAFLTAEKLIEKLTDSSTDESFKSAMYKVRAVLRSGDKDFLENIDEHIAVMKSRFQSPEKSSVNPLQLILKSISEKRSLSINYFAQHSQEKSERIIEPVGIFFLAGFWHLVAFCHLRNDYRNFRTDRISHISLTDSAYKKKHPSLKTWLEQITHQQKELHTIIMTVEKNAVRYLGDQKYYNGFVSQRELKNRMEMTFLTSSLEGFARWYLMFGDCAEIQSPDVLKKRIRQLNDSIRKKIN